MTRIIHCYGIRHTMHVIIVLCTLAMAAIGCSAGNDDVQRRGSVENGGTSGTATVNPGGGLGGIGGDPNGPPVLGIGGLTSGGAGGVANPGDGTPEICDGIDNDHNGIIDDVDVGHDGVCDCLNIATIGEIGPWGTGNVLAGWLNSRGPQPAVQLGDQEITEDLLRPFQVVVVLFASTEELDAQGRVLAAHHAFSAAEATALQNWVNAGGGIMTTIGYTPNEAAEAANINALLGGMGMGYSTVNLGVDQFVTDWVPHAVTNGVHNIFTNNGAEPDGTNGLTLARDGQGHVALQVAEVGSGHIITWGDEWITYDSEWANLTDEQVELFWLNMLKWLTPVKQCQVAIPPALIH